MTLADVMAGCVTFVIGAIGGSVFYFGKGTLRSSSRGCRLAGGVQEVVTNAPRVRRRSAWFGVLIAIEGVVTHARKVASPLNMAVAWGSANALFSMHRGTRATVREGLKGAAYGAALEIAMDGLERLAAGSGESSR